MKRKVAILIDELYEDAEFIYPFYRLLEAGAEVDVIARKQSSYRGKHGTTAKTTGAIESARVEDYDGVYIPGGYAPDKLRRSEKIVDFVRAAYEKGSVVCSVCHGPSLLISAGIVSGKRVTSFDSIKDDLLNAGAIYTGKEVETDGQLITAQDPHALPEMMKCFLAALDR